MKNRIKTWNVDVVVTYIIITVISTRIAYLVFKGIINL